MASCGQPPWLLSDAVGRLMETLLHIQRTTVPVAVGSGGDHPSRWADCTSCDTLRWPCVGVLAYALRTIRLASGLGIQDVGRAGAASWPWAITSRQNKKRPSHDTRLLGLSSAQALVTLDAGSGASIFTRVSCPQRLHLRGRFRAVVSARTFRSFPRWHTGQITHPSLTMILPQRMFDCKSFCPLFLRNQREYTYPRDRKE